MAPSIKELTGIVEEGVFAMAITVPFKGNTIDLFDVGISTPEDAWHRFRRKGLDLLG